MRTPYIQDYHDTKVLMVKEEPLIAFAGEVHNSSCSSIESFQEDVLSHIKDMNLNTLLLPVYWELVEQEEGVYDFTLLKDILVEVRKQGLHAILLWFGLWKNGLSTYCPTWMKQDRVTYPFIQKQDQTSVYTVTPLCKKAVEKDAQAFTHLMSFLYEFDHEEQTVIMVQVENEIGVLGCPRDYGTQATMQIQETIPQDLHDFVGKTGTWEEVFGSSYQEKFMAYHYALAIETIAYAGKQQYDLPMMVNTWLKKSFEEAGQYPSGGPNQEQIELYHFLAPSIDVCAPDIYVENFRELCDLYAKQGVLAVPETRQDKGSLSHCIYAMAAYPMICYAPFGIEDLHKDEEGTQPASMLSILGITKDAFQPEGSYHPLNQIYHDLRTMTPLLLEHRGTKHIYPFLKQRDESYQQFEINGIHVKVTFLKKEKQQMDSAGFIINMGSYWYVYGVECMFTLTHEQKQVGMLTYEDGSWYDGVWHRSHVLNGDERYVMWIGEEPRMLKIEPHLY